MLNALIISLIVLFLHATTWDGQIFDGIKQVIRPYGKLYMPIYGCPICMTPWWGTLIYLLFFNMGDWTHWLLQVGAAAGLSVLYVLLIDIRDYGKRFIDLRSDDKGTHCDPRKY